MNSKVELIDKSNNEVIYRGMATCTQEKSGWVYTFGPKDHTFIWKVYEKGLVIESLSEVHITLVLRHQKETTGHVEASFGRMDLQCHTSLYKINENCIEVIYQLIQGQDTQEFHFVLNILKEDNYAIH